MTMHFTMHNILDIKMTILKKVLKNWFAIFLLGSLDLEYAILKPEKYIYISIYYI